MTITRALVDRALAGASDTRHLTLDAGAVQRAASTFEAVFRERPAVVVADPTTWRVAGQRVEQELRRAGLATRPPIVLAAPLHASFDRVLELASAIGSVDATPVAVGSSGLSGNASKSPRPRSASRLVMVAWRYASLTATIVRSRSSTR